MSDLPRKNGWTIAEHAGDATPGKMQHLLQAAKWDTMAAMAAVRAFVCEHLDDGDAVAISDESGQEKKGVYGADPRRHLLIRRSLIPNAKGVCELAFYLCLVPEGRPATLRTLIRVAGHRWPMEEDFQTGKDTFVLDHSQVRTLPGAAPASGAMSIPPAPRYKAGLVAACHI